MRTPRSPATETSPVCTAVSWLKGAPTLPSATIARIHNCLLPILLLPRVRVKSIQERGLSSVELFLLESILRHGRLDLEAVATATGIPPGPLQVLLSRLVRQHVLSARDEGFVAIKEAAEKAIATGACPEPIESTMDFIFLPRTGDLGLLREADFRELTKLKPQCHAPVHKDMVGVDTANILAAAPNCFRHGWEILSAEEPMTIPRTCPACLCTGELVNPEHPQLWLSFAERNFTFDFTFAGALVEELTELASMNPPPSQIAHAAKLSPAYEAASEPRITAPGRLSLPLPKPAIEQLMPNRLLVSPTALAARWEGPAIVASIEYEIRFQPELASDAPAFATDRVVQHVCSCDGDPNPSLAAWIEDACTEFQITAAEITKPRIAERTWALGEFSRTYALHQEEDFSYDRGN